MKQMDDIRKLSELSESQWGMFTTAQAERIGVERWQLSGLFKKKHIERLDFGVYRLEGAPTERFSDIKAGWISTDPKKFVWERLKEREHGIVVGGHTAANLYDAGDLWATPLLFIADKRRQTRKKNIVFRKYELSRKDVILVEGLPTATPELTIAILAAEGNDLSHIEDVVRDLHRTRIINEEELALRLTPYAKKYGFSNGNGEAFARKLIWNVVAQNIQSIKDSAIQQLKGIDFEKAREMTEASLDQIAWIQDAIDCINKDQ